MIGMKFARALLARFLLSLFKGRSVTVLPNSTLICYRLVTVPYRYILQVVALQRVTGCTLCWHGFCMLSVRADCKGFIRVDPNTFENRKENYGL